MRGNVNNEVITRYAIAARRVSIRGENFQRLTDFRDGAGVVRDFFFFAIRLSFDVVYSMYNLNCA